MKLWLNVYCVILFSSAAGLAEVPRGYSFHITGSGSTCEEAKTNALSEAQTDTELSPDADFANNQVTNSAQAIALCQVRSGQLGFTVTPSEPEFGEGWSPDLTGVGRLTVEDSVCSYDPTEENYHVTNEANGICLSAAERANPPEEE